MEQRYDKVSIIIPTYQDKKLEECLKRIEEKTTYMPHDLYIAEDTLQQGIAENMNFYIGHTYPNDVLKIDSHTMVLTANWIWYLNSFKREHPGVGVIAPMYTHIDGVNIQYSPKLYLNRRLVNIWPSGKPSESITEPQKVDAVSGACVYYTREALNKVGGYDLIAGADTDLCLRIRKVGFDIYVIPQVKVWHAVGSYTNMEQYNKWLKEGMPKFEERWGKWDCLAMKDIRS